MRRVLLLACAAGAVLAASAAAAQSPGFLYDHADVADGAAKPPPPGQPTALQLANPNYQPPARRPDPTAGYLKQIEPQGQGATPRLANGKPDLTGVWSALPGWYGGPRGARSKSSGEPDQAALQRSAYTNRPVYKPQFWDKVRSLDFSTIDTDPVFNCLPAGMPRDGNRPNILMTDKQIWLNHKWNKTRVAPLDGRARNPDDEDQSTAMGIPLGHWDGDTLVLESTGFSDETWFAWPGYFHSDRMTLVERLTRKGDLMYYQYTLTDPEVLEQPFTSLMSVWKIDPDPKAVWIEPSQCIVPPIDGGIVDKYYRG